MTKIDSKLIYNLLISNNILEYLNISEKKEFSSCCKFIYEKCTGIRLKNLKFCGLEFQAYVDNTQKGKNWGHESYKLKVEYFETIINKRKNILTSLVYGGSDYLLIEHFSLKFVNLNSLLLDYITIPKNILKNIIKNLVNLRSLLLWGISVAYSKNDFQVSDFKFSKYLRELRWDTCKQLELDSTDYLKILKYRSIRRSARESILDISLNLINSLNYLDWQPMGSDDNQIFNEIITNNPGLTTLSSTLNCFNSASFKYISTNSNLTKLIISNCGDFLSLNSIHLCKLPNIKILEFQEILGEISDSLDLLIENCPNLEELKLPYFYECDQYIINYINNLTKLKVLTININDYTLSFLDSVLLQSNLEKLEIDSISPIKFNFNNFANMKNLKHINNMHMHIKSNSKYQIPEYEELNDWRMISYPTSTQYWKIK
ncbi:hypothetical protein CONCODRAFT_17225 [Conidiobolus coronatus NRRL 28638]|uniref:RNI-like protein n=1 Tax=Conidiobolus coronatus (strain ATCC 28846 / CBS 209.66 / NRRL 28638) TaxID=796925 RepID=A0A137P7I0_CONC2|nr:hypothetical protein CONCODRAFT_17225 [Conidiobolus coronatus NRRL 28638]|eukprot:KXN70952.1 hypothetical protein CONCODRAFT_17225 [Conidiobolus coronatus NRRL 28638]